MIIISFSDTFYFTDKFKNKAWCKDNTYISQINFVDDEYSEVLMKSDLKHSIQFHNLDCDLHHPSGPAVIYKPRKDFHYPPLSNEYWINGERKL